VAEEVAWASGRIIDSIYVVGNRKVRDFAIMREMELRVGMRFDPVSFDRDQRYVGDLGVFSDVVMTVESLGDDSCAIRITVTERPTILLKLVYPVLDYNFDTERIRYGVKWNDPNFRKRLESFSVDYIRDNRNNDSAAISWGTRWLGWKRVGVGLRASYFHRGDDPTDTAIVEQGRLNTALSLPLNNSQLRASQLLTGLSFTDNRLDAIESDGTDEEMISPSIGYLFDSRDSQLKPRHGGRFFANVLANRVINGEQHNYYRLTNDVRFFRPLNPYSVVGLWSHLDYQFGQFPEYIHFNLGGQNNLRGYEPSTFEGAHVWNQSVEMRITPWAKRFYRLPIAGLSDFLVSLVMFADTGIAWDEESEFALQNFHAGYGWGLRLFSPFQDVARFDVGYNQRGRVRLYFSTGVRF